MIHSHLYLQQSDESDSLCFTSKSFFPSQKIIDLLKKNKKQIPKSDSVESPG